MEGRSWLGIESITSLLIGIIVVALGYLLGYARNLMSTSGMLMSLGLVVLDVLLLMGFLRLLAIPELGRISNQCKGTVEARAMGGITVRVQGLITIDELKAVEGSASEEVWIMCPSLLLDRGDLRDVIIGNLMRGVNYRYIVPDTKQVRARYEQLLKIWRERGVDISTQVHVLFVRHSEIFTDVGIYDPMTDKARAVIWTPPLPEFEKYGDKYQKGFLVDDPEPIDYLVSFFQGLWEVKRDAIIE